MAEINVKRFVDINIKAEVPQTVVGTRDTVTLFTPEGTKGTTNLISNMTEATAYYKNNATTLAYLTVFFENGGAKCNVVEGMAYTDVTADVLKSLGNEYILVAIAIPQANLSAGYTAVKTLATAMAADASVYGVNEKIIMTRTETAADTTSVANLAVKYSTVLGAEMTIGAYLSQINVYRADSIHDYAFTAETLTAEDITDTTFGTITDNNMNVNLVLAGQSRDCGGNMKNGADITNTFTKILLHQTLTDRLLNLLTQKIKNSRGIAQIYTVIAQELEQYKTAGYLTTDKIWAKDDLTVAYNGENYTIITRGTALPVGYRIKVLPITSLTAADKAARKAPPIYVIIADQYGIRQITISGEVI